MPEQIGNDNSKSLSAIGYYWLIAHLSDFIILSFVFRSQKHFGDASLRPPLLLCPGQQGTQVCRKL